MYAHTSPSYVVGVDVGGTKIATLLVDQRRQVCGHLTVATDLTSPQHTLTCIIDAIRATLRQGNVEPERLRAIGLGIPGQVVPTTGVVKLAVNLGWDAMPVGALINAAFGVPCVLENDVRAAAWGLYRMGHVDDAQSLAYVSIGTGIAAGLVLDGRVYRGWSGMAGEIGHSCVDPSGPRCACGQHGCLEAMAAGPAIAALAAGLLRSDAPTSLRELRGPVGAAEVYAAAAAGDPAAHAIGRQVGKALARSLYTLALTYDVERIVLGGGVTAAGAAFFDPIMQELAEITQSSPLARSILSRNRIQLAPSAYHAGMWGAVALTEFLPGMGADGARLHVPSLVKEELLTPRS